MTAHTAIWKQPQLQLAFEQTRDWRQFLLRLGALVAFAMLSFAWPGPAILALLCLVGGAASAVAARAIHDAFFSGDAIGHFQAAGAAIAFAGATALVLAGESWSVFPLALGAWVGGLCNDVWRLFAALALATFGVVLLAETGATVASVASIAGAYVLCLGGMIAGLAPRLVPVAIDTHSAG